MTAATFEINFARRAFLSFSSPQNGVNYPRPDRDRVGTSREYPGSGCENQGIG